MQHFPKLHVQFFQKENVGELYKISKQYPHTRFRLLTHDSHTHECAERLRPYNTKVPKKKKKSTKFTLITTQSYETSDSCPHSNFAPFFSGRLRVFASEGCAAIVRVRASAVATDAFAVFRSLRRLCRVMAVAICSFVFLSSPSKAFDGEFGEGDDVR